MVTKERTYILTIASVGRKSKKPLKTVSQHRLVFSSIAVSIIIEKMVKYTKYTNFFQFYLREHSKPTTRNFHFAGTMGYMVWLGYCLITAQFMQIPWCLLIGYGPAWVSHFFIEKNKPATFTYPIWSFIADHHMLALALIGGLDDALNSAGVKD